MTRDAKNRFLSKLEHMAEELYRRGDSINHDEAWERQRSFLWGYGDAGKTIDLVNSEDIQRVIDRAHEQVYGESRVSRVARLNSFCLLTNKRDSSSTTFLNGVNAVPNFFFGSSSALSRLSKRYFWEATKTNVPSSLSYLYTQDPRSCSSDRNLEM